MKSNFTEEGDAYKIETVYDKDESENVRRSVCTCLIDGNKHKFAHLAFFDDEGREVGKFDFDNDSAYYHYYHKKEGIPITEYGVILIVSRNISCHSIKDGSLVWQQKVKLSGQLSVYKNKIYYEWLTMGKIGVWILSAATGEFLGRAIDFEPKKREVYRPTIGQLNKDYLIAYMLGYVYLYDFEKNILLLTNVVIDEKEGVSRIVTIRSISEEEINFNFRDFEVIGHKGVVEYKDFPIKKERLIEFAKPSNYPNKILTNKEALEREFTSLFGSI